MVDRRMEAMVAQPTAAVAMVVRVVRAVALRASIAPAARRGALGNGPIRTWNGRMPGIVQRIGRTPSTVPAARERSPGAYVGLVFGLSAPLWVVGGITGRRLPADLPLAALQAFAPVLAALLLVSRESGPAGARALLARSFDAGRIGSKAWFAPILLTFPTALLLTVVVTTGSGMALPAPVVPIAPAAAMTVAFVFSGLGEELGWSGYATEPLQARWGALNAALLLGFVWAVWHFVPLAQAGHAQDWIAGWTILTVAARVLTVWIYNNTGRSVFATALFHASSNVCTVIFAAYFVPTVTGPIVAAMAAVVVALWGPHTLARFRRA